MATWSKANFRIQLQVDNLRNKFCPFFSETENEKAWININDTHRTKTQPCVLPSFNWQSVTATPWVPLVSFSFTSQNFSFTLQHDSVIGKERTNMNIAVPREAQIWSKKSTSVPYNDKCMKTSSLQMETVAYVCFQATIFLWGPL